MRSQVARQLGIEFPIFAFTHCRDVVAAVCQAGAFGVLGAIGFSPEELQTELEWLDAHVTGGYGVDIVIPARYEGMDESDPARLEARLEAMVPEDHRRFARRLLAEHGVPEIPGEEQRSGMMGWTAATAGPLLEVALSHQKVRLVANALGTPPADVVAAVRGSGRMMAALAGSAHHARRHVEAGVDLVICQGTEGGGHTGEIGSMVLWPEVVEAVWPTPVLAAGGVGSGRQMAAAMALGAQGVWTGTLWLTVEEADIPPGQMASYLAASSSDTTRSRSFTGKPCRMLRNDWTEAWESDESPGTLPMPMQMLVAIEALSRGRRYPEQAARVSFDPCGQVIGSARRVRRARDVVAEMVEEYIDTVESMAGTLVT